MKTTIIISMLCLSAMGSYAQSQDAQSAERQAVHERAVAIFQATNGNMGPKTVMHYKNSNYDYTSPSKNTAAYTGIRNERMVDGNFDVSRENTYLGYYSDIRSVYPQAPANAVPSVPIDKYTTLQSPPCYTYKTKRGLEVQECPGARFEPEHVYRN